MRIRLFFFVLLMPFLVRGAEIAGFARFQGDSYQGFKGDPVVVLDDGSLWKVHPGKKNEINSWKVGDKIRVSFRESCYILKREHKFLLINYDTENAAPAMIVDYGATPVTVAHVSESYTDWRGQISQYFNAGRVVDLILSNGRKFVVSDHPTAIQVGDPVYCSMKELNEDVLPFIITGLERDSDWHAVVLEFTD